MHMRIIIPAILLSLNVFGCASIPKNPARTESVHLPAATAGILSDVSARVLADMEPEESAFVLMEDSAEALLWRLALIDHATTSIDLQYYIWTNDEAGRLLLNRVIQAAERGVRVRILVDDFPIRGTNAGATALSQVPNLSARYHNPGRFRSGKIRPLVELAVKFGELNRRMHNKLTIVDGAWAIVGGRNIGNPYFGLSKKYNFQDLEVLTAGAILPHLKNAFDEYWNSPPAYPTDAMTKGASDQKVEAAWNGFFEKVKQDQAIFADCPVPVYQRDWEDALNTLPAEMISGLAWYVQDKPVTKGKSVRQLQETLDAYGPRAEQEKVIVTPYLIPPRTMIETWQKETTAGIELVILTASMAANNHTIAHSHYKKYRRWLIRSGVDLHEFNHQPEIGQRQLADTPPVEAGFVALHTKAAVVDRRHVFLGSLNMDPRAVDINTENVIWIESPALAEEMLDVTDRMLKPENSWQLYLNDSGALRWRAGDEIRMRQPARSGWQRVSDFFFRLLPIEGQL
jgi:putative cardiolipin synthase